MKSNYLSAEDDLKIIDIPNSYLSDFNYNIISDYNYLPEEYDIFSNIKTQLFEILDKKDEQAVFIGYFYKLFKANLQKLFSQNKLFIELPKFSLNEDNDGAYIFILNKQNYRFFINFEKKKEDSFYGFILQNNNFVINSQNGKISEDNCLEIINLIVNYIIN